jgi:predicted RNA-binding protein with PUA-like domain
VLKNRDILKELKSGMLLAYKCDNSEIPNIAQVVNIPPNPTMDSAVGVVLYKQEKAPHKPRWLRFFTVSDKTATVSMCEILLYDFQLTNKGALRKKTRDFFHDHYS